MTQTKPQTGAPATAAPKSAPSKSELAAQELNSDAPSIRAVQLTKWYGQVTALQDVSLHLGPGIWGLLGPNGFGKTTFLRLAAGQLRPSLGSVRVCGAAPFANPDVLRRVGLCPEADAMYDELTGLEHVTALAELSGYPTREAKERAAHALGVFGLTDAMERRVGGYSRGMRQRTKLAQAIVHEPDVLILDEPLTGTDPRSRQVILEALRTRAEAGAVVLFSTHVLHEVEALTDRVMLIARGQLVAQGEVSEIRDLLHEHPHHIHVRCERPREFASLVLRADASIASLQLHPDAVTFRTSTPDQTYMQLAEVALASGHPIESITSPDATLEALFHYLVERGSAGAGTGADAAVGSAKAVGS